MSHGPPDEGALRRLAIHNASLAIVRLTQRHTQRLWATTSRAFGCPRRKALGPGLAILRSGRRGDVYLNGLSKGTNARMRATVGPALSLVHLTDRIVRDCAAGCTR
jgi:hypothetical protein